ILSENRKTTFRDHALSGHGLFRKPGGRFRGSCRGFEDRALLCPGIPPEPTGLSPKRRRRPRVAKHGAGPLDPRRAPYLSAIGGSVKPRETARGAPSGHGEMPAAEAPQ